MLRAMRRKGSIAVIVNPTAMREAGRNTALHIGGTNGQDVGERQGALVNDSRVSFLP